MEEFPIVVLDVDDPLLAIGLAWLAILGVLAWGGLIGLWRLARGRKCAPFFGMLERHGVTLIRAEEVAGFRGVAEAASRCASCDTRDACGRVMRWGFPGSEAPPCLNAAFFERVRGSSV
jgi:Family of unknown function (DUF6455)